MLITISPESRSPSSESPGNLQRDDETEEAVTWMPRVEVRQSGSNLIIQAELPGLNENDVKLACRSESVTAVATSKIKS
jgi:HSP20 family molecular chaperone IbpA